MSCFQINGCCCCFSLRTGCLIIGWMLTIISLYYLLEVKTEFDLIGNSSSTPGFSFGEDQRPKFEPKAQVTYSVDTLAVLNLLTAILLLIGTYKGRAEFLIPYMIISVFELIILAIVLLVLFFGSHLLLEHASQGNGSGSDAAGAVGVILFIVGIAVALYASVKYHFFLVVNSYHTVLLETRRGIFGMVAVSQRVV